MGSDASILYSTRASGEELLHLREGSFGYTVRLEEVPSLFAMPKVYVVHGPPRNQTGYQFEGPAWKNIKMDELVCRVPLRDSVSSDNADFRS